MSSSFLVLLYVVLSRKTQNSINNNLFKSNFGRLFVLHNKVYNIVVSTEYRKAGFNLITFGSDDTFTIVTTEAVRIMDYIHNTKYRMPIVLNDGENLMNWLDCKPIVPFTDFSYQREDGQMSLFM